MRCVSLWHMFPRFPTAYQAGAYVRHIKKNRDVLYSDLTGIVKLADLPNLIDCQFCKGVTLSSWMRRAQGPNAWSGVNSSGNGPIDCIVNRSSTEPKMLRQLSNLPSIIVQLANRVYASLGKLVIGSVGRVLRARKHFGYSPTVLQSAANHTNGKTCNLGPLFQRMGFSVMRNSDSASAVIDLDVACCPSHVTGLVPQIVVNAINAVLRGWARSNMGKEGIERTSPLFAYRNPSGSIVLIVFGLFVVASGLHSSPNAELCGVGSAMRSQSHGCLFSSPAAARFNSVKRSAISSEIRDSRNGRFSAIAKTSRPSPFARNNFYDR